MLRRPLTAAAAAFAGGVAYQHLSRGLLAGTVMALAGAVLLILFFYLYIECNKLENKDNIRKAPGNSEEASDELADAARMKRIMVRAFAIAGVFFILGGVWGRLSEDRSSYFNNLYGNEVTIAGRIIHVEVRPEDRCRIRLRAVAADTDIEGGDIAYDNIRSGFIKSEGVIITVDGIDGKSAAALMGRIAAVRGVIEAPAGASNPGAFDYNMYLRSQKVLSTMYADAGSLAVSEAPASPWFRLMNAVSVFRQDYEDKVASLMNDECAQMLAGILFGDDSLMEDQLRESFQKNGLAHLLAASGLHAGFVYGLFHVLFGRPSTFRGNLPVIGMLIVYSALAGFSASVVRAVFMISVLIAGKVRHRRYDFLTCISFCALVLLVYEPMNLFASGFQLSFMAVFTLSIVLKRAQALVTGFCRMEGDRKGDRIKPLAGILVSMLALQMGMLPMTLRSFHYISLGAFLLNVPAIALAGLIVPLGIILIPFIYIGGPLLTLAAGMEEMLVRLLIWMNDLVYGTAFSFRYQASPPSGIFIFYYLCLFFICSEAGQAVRKWSGELGSALKEADPVKGKGAGSCLRPVGVIMAAFAVVSIAVGIAIDGQYLMSDLIFVDVGQGDCAHLKAGRGMDIIFDSGGSTERDVGEDVLIPYFLGNGVSDIDLAVISHLHTDHYAGLLTMKDGVRIKKLMLSAAYESQAEKICQETGIAEEDIVFASAGDVLKLKGGVTLRVLAPLPADSEYFRQVLENEEDENHLSLIVQAEYKGRRILFTGDIDSGYEEELLKIYGDGDQAALRSDVLKVAHHGSRYSSSGQFLSAVRPELSVIQVGRNFYGHPSPETLERLNDAGIPICRNDESGAVMLDLGRRIRVFTMK